ncbi:putative F-box-like domain superfamily protein [Helianthus annuus]|nr:putative F-box-like domain superfamily protein [Helianthus annuus]
MKSKRFSKAKRLSLDIITTLPQPIIETILCLLPIKEAARTSILSRDWRYKWTNIPKLVFSKPNGKQIMETSKLIRAIHQVMSLRHDPIHEFTLSVDVDCFGKTGLPSCEVDQIICYLSKNHPVKKLRLDFDISGRCSYNLPFSVFSLHHLTELYLSWCGLDHQEAFNGFGSLIVLSLDFVWISRKTLLSLLSSCPSLKSFRLIMLEDQVVGHENSTMIELFQCLPLIEHLTIWSETIWWFVPDLVPQELPTSLIHLKYFCMEQMSFHHGYALAFLAVLIKNSPNLEKIELQIDAEHYLFNDTDYDSDVYEEYHSDVWLEHLSNVWLEHLIELKITDFSNLEPELEFVKLILAKSPKLKKVSIKSVVKRDQEPGMLKTLLRTPRVSAVEIDVV